MNKLTMGDPETKSADLVAENLGALKALFPETFTEGKIDFEALKQLLGGVVNERDEKYGLNWHGKRQARQLALTPSTGTLRPCPEESTDWETTKNLMIEGDNLEVLKLLQKSYAGKVKLIYIDPPYNTGKDFVYPDNYRDNIQNYLELTGQIDGENRKLSSNTESSGRFHTDWLNMMYPRLKVARSLLESEGVLLISIDDGKKYPFNNAGNPASVLCFPPGSVRFSCDDQLVPAQDMSEGNILTELLDDVRIVDGVNVNEFRLKGEWRYSQDKVEEFVAANAEIVISKIPFRPNYINRSGEMKKTSNLLSHRVNGVPTNEDATEEMRMLFGMDIMSYPKPTGLLKYLVRAISSGDDTVMDFFSGSGSTAHAVMSQNAADGNGRRYILVQLPEPLDPQDKDQKTAADFCDKLGKPRNIAELTKERLRRAARKITDENPMFTPGDLGFRVFKLDTSNIRAWEPDRDNLEGTLLDSIDHIKPDRSEEDILYELLLKLGHDLCVPIQTRTIAGKSVRSIGGGALIACLDEKIAREEVEPLALGIAEWHTQLSPAGDNTVVFRDSAFEDDVTKTNCAAILKQHELGNVRSL